MNLVVRLNHKMASVSLPAEWESIVLSAFCQCGRITHEEDHGGNTRPDLLFQFGQSGNLKFLTDVRVVSDKDPHEKNPYDDFCEAISQFLQRRSHNAAGLHIEVQDMERGEYGARKVRLMLPPKQEIEAFVATALGDFLSGIARSPNKDDAFSYEKNDVKFSIRYDGNEKRISGGGHISYTVPYSISNPLTNALKNKGEQLWKSGYRGTKGIIICDGGCDALNERSRVNGAYGCQEIVEGYLRTHTYILWVLVLRIEQRHGVFPSDDDIAIKSKLYWNPEADKLLFRDTVTALKRMVMHLPRPEATPTNALHWMNGNNAQVGRALGGYSMQSNTIKISARALTELLAGKIEPQTFLENNGFKPHPQNPKAFSFNFFASQITSGNTIQNAFIEKGEHKDDDWIVLEYEGPDPAISPFQIPD